MKLTLVRGDLARALGHASRVVERRTTIPILSNVLLRTDGTALRLKATDLDMEITESVPAEIGAPGALAVPAAILHDIARKLPDRTPITLEQTGERLTVRGGRARFSLPTLSETDFPDLSAGELPHAWHIEAKVLADLFGHAAFAISAEETRYYLNGIFLHVEGRDDAFWLRAVATDGHRLARLEREAPDGSALMPGVIVPRKTVAEVQKLLGDPAFAEGAVQVEMSEAKLRLTFGEGAGALVLTSKLIDGTFPDYQRVIPRDNPRRLAVARAALTAAVERVATISAERGRAVRLDIAEGKLTLTVRTPEASDAVEDLDAEFSGEPMTIGFNARYLLDIVAEMAGPTVLLDLADPGSPTLLRDREDARDIFVLMPMRV